MANSSQTSRRNFLSTLAILSAGAVIGSASSILPAPQSPTDLHLQWKSFYSRNGGMLFHETFHSADKAQVNVCSGHVYTTGQPICFSDENLVAEPTWIYWEADKKHPADVIIAFFTNEAEKKKVFRINRFELEGLHALSSGLQDKQIMTLMNQDAQKGAYSNDHIKKLQIKTLVKKDQCMYLSASHEKRTVNIKRNFIYQS